MSKAGNFLKNALAKAGEIKWRFQLPVYELERCENRYSEMAAKGWLLRRRGPWLDSYRRGECQKLRYRMEFCPVKAFDGVQELSEEQVDFYSECGWTKVCERSGVYVFCAPEDSETTELYTDPEEQIRMLKSVRNYLDNFGWTYMLACVGAWIGKFLISRQSILCLEALYAIDWLIFAILAYFVYVIWKYCYGRYRCRRLIRRVKEGKPLHEQGQSAAYPIAGVVRRILLTVLGICLAGSVVMCLRRTKSSLPPVGAQTPYLLAQEIYGGDRSDEDELSGRRENEVTWTPALLADYYDTTEYLKTDKGGFVSIDQDCYVLRGNGAGALGLAKSLMKGSVFADWDDYEELERSDFDYVAVGRYTLVAAKDEYVIRIICIASGNRPDNDDWSAMLDALGDKWR